MHPLLFCGFFFFIYLFYFIYFFISLYLLYVSAVIADRAFLYMVRDCHNFSGIILDSLIKVYMTEIFLFA